MNGADDGFALPGQAPQQAHHRGRHEGVQAAGRLVTEQQHRVGQHLDITHYVNKSCTNTAGIGKL